MWLRNNYDFDALENLLKEGYAVDCALRDLRVLSQDQRLILSQGKLTLAEVQQLECHYKLKALHSLKDNGLTVELLNLSVLSQVLTSGEDLSTFLRLAQKFNIKDSIAYLAMLYNQGKIQDFLDRFNDNFNKEDFMNFLSEVTSKCALM